MELEKISISGISDVYAVSAIKKEFKKAVNQPWKNSEPYPEYQKNYNGKKKYRKGGLVVLFWFFFQFIIYLFPSGVQNRQTA